MTDLPAIVDADTGFGEPMNVARTVPRLEDAGLAGLHIEDQVNPKRCGHLDGKPVVAETAMARKSAAAVARAATRTSSSWRAPTSAPSTGSTRRSAGGARRRRADAIFPEAMASLEEFRAIRAAVDVPILANMTEFGKTRSSPRRPGRVGASTSSSTRSRCCASRWARSRTACGGSPRTAINGR